MRDGIGAALIRALVVCVTVVGSVAGFGAAIVAAAPGPAASPVTTTITPTSTPDFAAADIPVSGLTLSNVQVTPATYSFLDVDGTVTVTFDLTNPSGTDSSTPVNLQVNSYNGGLYGSTATVLPQGVVIPPDGTQSFTMTFVLSQEYWEVLANVVASDISLFVGDGTKNLFSVYYQLGMPAATAIGFSCAATLPAGTTAGTTIPARFTLQNNTQAVPLGRAPASQWASITYQGITSTAPGAIASGQQFEADYTYSVTADDIAACAGCATTTLSATTAS
ncbi:MAG TPA: hypothetical protein VFQ54_06695, partial [Thermomicrobiales bacterium]|nr:hypothetical protein [Thermomicrobiales bacterium]